MIKWLTLAFTCFIVFIIVQANLGNNAWFMAIQRMIPHADKVGHFVLVGIMALLLNLSLTVRQISFAGRFWLLGSIILTVIFTVEEFSQLRFAHRTFDLGDLTMDYLGIFVFGRIARAISPYIKADKTTLNPL